MFKSYIFLLVFLTGFFSVNAQADWLTPELLWKLGRVSDPQLSPDGSLAVYNIRRFNVSENKSNCN